MYSLDVVSILPALTSDLAARGYATVTLRPEAARSDIARLCRELAGRPGTCDGEEFGYIETRPNEEAPVDEPFNRPEAIGWHNDFSTHAHRPALSLAYIEREDPRGPDHGAWRVASCDRVLERLDLTPDGRRVARFLAETTLPYCFTSEGAPSFFRALEPRGLPHGRLGLRFYGRAMRDGARLVHGVVPDEIEQAIRAVEAAADTVGIVLPAPAGALLVTDNWHCLHDRLAQTVDSDLPLRRSVLCFVEALGESGGRDTALDHPVPPETSAPPQGSSMPRAG